MLTKVTIHFTHFTNKQKKFIVNSADEMDQADEELRGTITHIWPFQAKKMLDLLVPRNEHLNRSNLTVGKIYAGLLILESWRNTRFGQLESGIPVNTNRSFTAPMLTFSVYYFQFLL